MHLPLNIFGYEHLICRSDIGIMVEFDDPNDGMQHRSSLSDDIKRKYPGNTDTDSNTDSEKRGTVQFLQR